VKKKLLNCHKCGKFVGKDGFYDGYLGGYEIGYPECASCLKQKNSFVSKRVGDDKK